MARLRREMVDETEVELRPDHLVGRSRVCLLVLRDDAVSAQHAALRWTPEGWQVRDLGSRNGTWVDGARLDSGGTHPLGRGSTIAFGRRDLAWRLVDEAPPAARASAVGGLERMVIGLPDALSLPTDDDPQVTLYRGPTEGWLAESGDTSWAVRDGDTVEAGGERWLLELPEPVSRTAAHGQRRSLEELRLVFTVSPDEEHVALCAVDGLDLGSRAHHYLLLTLARARLADDAGPASERGWLHMHSLCRMLLMTEQQVNLQIWRARKQLTQAGVVDGAAIVERRTGTGLVRIGAARLEIERAVGL